MIVTLAGHVDHGKTTLVRALTGINTDRLEQERERGLTIDLGFAYIDDGRVGFVDVPGHHRFIHNMVAGVARHQHALLVIAADDGPMPQSKEHLDILSLVGLEKGAIAMTKCDRVDEARAQACAQEIQQLVTNTFLADAPVFKTQADDSDSYTELLEHLRGNAQQHSQQTNDRPFRLAVDRAFNLKGAGLVVTGTVHCGSIGVDETLYHFPSGSPVRVRSIRAQDQAVSLAQTSERCALNISGMSLQDVQRGDWFTAVASPQYKQISVQLDVLADFPRAIKHWTPIHLYHATSHSTGRLALLNEGTLSAGAQTLVDVVLDEPVSVQHGDRIVLRDHSLDVTLGGGRVIFAETNSTVRRRNSKRLAFLESHCHNEPTKSFLALTKETPVVLNEFCQWRDISIDALRQAAAEVEFLGDVAVDRSNWQRSLRAAMAQITQHRQAQPSSSGLHAHEFTDVDAALRPAALAALVQTKHLRLTGSVYSLPQQTVELPKELEPVWAKLQAALNVKQAPSSGDLAKLWRIPQRQLEQDLKALAKRGLLVHVANHRYYLPKQLQDLAETAKTLASERAFSVRQFRDATAVGRNIAIEVLEYFDGRGFTKRQDNERVVLNPGIQFDRARG